MFLLFQLFSDSRHLYWNAQFFDKPPIVMCNNLQILEISFTDDDPVVSFNSLTKPC